MMSSTEGHRKSSPRRMKLRPSSYQQQLNAKNAAGRDVRASKWDGLNLWNCDNRAWDNGLCGLCRNKLQEACIECEGREQDDMFSALNMNRSHYAPTKECPRAMGQCTHSYHWHCIGKWLKAKNQCPIDRLEWKYQNVE
mmetsp:Transcript_59700/g.94970  ORF Transcript_59700/g.94970 Transcript_59700/m.94970 type:complete len:139 (+) Transcript_59700:110-526(+)|eukprot:CAMPEP_0197034590 /NCGR_PEP_ID=MMETSP1384-20130603/12661_1 /TAXON_ID=29189 /ORGANISM="Ammonia sp." /LENGTH=138 /DNA_ID=CAMNT_0042464539 /DNA_START=87 /DNA_END=503 /DNA_ORIENTATION=-